MRDGRRSGRRLVHELNNRLMVLHGELYLLAAQVAEASPLRPFVNRAADSLAQIQQLVRALTPEIPAAPPTRALRSVAGTLAAAARAANE
jgi:hypothetical protein